MYSQITSLTHFAPHDAGATASSGTMQNARNRTSDSIGYASPKIGGMTVRARMYFRGAGTATQPEDAANATDLGLEYQTGQLKTAIAYAKDTRTGGLNNNEFSDNWQVGVNYQIQKNWELYALVGLDTYKNTTTTRQDVEYKLLGTAYTIGQHKVVLNTMKRDVQSSLTGVRTNVNVRAIGLGVRHNF